MQPTHAYSGPTSHRADRPPTSSITPPVLGDLAGQFIRGFLVQAKGIHAAGWRGEARRVEVCGGASGAGCMELTLELRVMLQVQGMCNTAQIATEAKTPSRRGSQVSEEDGKHGHGGAIGNGAQQAQQHAAAVDAVGEPGGGRRRGGAGQVEGQGRDVRQQQVAQRCTGQWWKQQQQLQAGAHHGTNHTSNCRRPAQLC